jgi:hypothetical protein
VQTALTRRKFHQLLGNPGHSIEHLPSQIVMWPEDVLTRWSRGTQHRGPSATGKPHDDRRAHLRHFVYSLAAVKPSSRISKFLSIQCRYTRE